MSRIIDENNKVLEVEPSENDHEVSIFIKTTEPGENDMEQETKVRINISLNEAQAMLNAIRVAMTKVVQRS